MSKQEAPIYRYSHLIILFFLSLSTFSKDISDYQETKSLQFQCIQKILNHPFTKAHYPNLTTDQTSSMYYEFLTQIDQFCNCQSSIQKSENKEKNADFFNWSFKDKRITFEKEDQCILKNFSDHAIHTIYTIALDTKLRKHLNLRIKHRLPNSAYHLATESSAEMKFNCIEEKILRSCSKIKSLRTTYNCIQSSTDNFKEFDTFERQCPQFQNEQRLAQTVDLI
ncbi:hypothetical protein [Halobacteriovorax sp. JY17]|uniref:hypothetical protein n=1 Tax=Halobacteriovorax sp. JY17 TaxID=2014617 RepID=UPI000C51035D|nr:hypothetical protein [Halobacteriovorax sp. JY17]PIK16358.1 MAG: hypothetical protein CES88_06345 [Halobacteriovorax sp. JY17]